MARVAVMQKTFTELEFERQGVRMPKLLRAISDFLDGQVELVEQVREDLVRGVKNPKKGRGGMHAEQVLRSWILQRIKNWPLRELQERIADGYGLRIFTRFFGAEVPKHDAFNRSFQSLCKETVRAINKLVAKGAVNLGIEDGENLRVDTTAVETDIHYPTDSSLLADSVRVITRLVVERVRKLCPELVAGFSNHVRRTKRRAREIDRLSGSGRRTRSWARKYRELVRVTEKVVTQARAVVAASESVEGLDVLQEVALKGLCQEIGEFCRRADLVLDQTRRRVFQGEAVPAEEKIYSIFEIHTDLIKRGKVRKPLEFGHKVFFAETASGLISDYQILKGNPPDTEQVLPSLQRHQELFGRLPELYAGDRGFHSEATVKVCSDAGVLGECLPHQRGKRTPERETYQKSKSFRDGQRFRAGIEGRISVLFRGRGMKRCLLEGRDRFETFVGAAVLANNLLAIAAAILKDPTLLSA
jgi:IS5 family transposase